MPDKFEVSGITSFATIDGRGMIALPSEIIYEMFGTVENAAGTELRVHWNRENNSITLKKFMKNKLSRPLKNLYLTDTVRCGKMYIVEKGRLSF